MVDSDFDVTAESDAEESVFNFALATLQRIHDTLTVCNVAAMEHDYMRWIDALSVVYREISPIIFRKEQAAKENKKGADKVLWKHTKDAKARVNEEKRLYSLWYQKYGKLPSERRPFFDYNNLTNSLEEFDMYLRIMLDSDNIYLTYRKKDDLGKVLM